jgi:hypothetical protein
MRFISLYIPEEEINLHFVNSAILIFSINHGGHSDVTKHVGTVNPFFHRFIILYLNVWLRRFYIQNAAECTILRPSEKKTPPTAFSLSRVGMYADGI